MAESKRPRVIITGGSGNLGCKLAHYFTTLNTFEVHIFEQPGYYFPERLPKGLKATVTDMSILGDWIKEFVGAHVVIHLAAVNPYVSATWEQSGLSVDINNNVFLAACQAGVSRVVFASSNHVMGGHKDTNLGGGASINLISPNTLPLVGTIVITAAGRDDSTAYAVAKFTGERLARSLAHFYPKTSFVALRIGWCQPGPNHPDTMSASGMPGGTDTKAFGEKGNPQSDAQILTNWFKLMWLSNPDFVELVTLAATKPLPAECRGYVLLNGMSQNKGMRWDLEPTRRILGYQPKSDCQAKDPGAGDPQGYGLHLLKHVPKPKL